MNKPLAWCHPRMDDSNLQLVNKYFQQTRRLDDAHVAFINHETDQYPLSNNTNLRVIASNTTEPILDMDSIPFNEKVRYLYLDDPIQLETITSTAEHTLGLILACHRRLPEAIAHVQDGKWNRYELGVPKMLSRSTLTIVGYGRIGRMLADYCRPLFELIYVVRKSQTPRQEGLLSRTDILAICASAQPDGCPIIGLRELSLLPPGAIVVNTSRAENLDTKALFDLFQYGRIGGIGLDVVDDWGRNTARRYMQAGPHNNIIVTPHIGGSTQDAWHDTQRWIIERVIEELKGVEPR